MVFQMLQEETPPWLKKMTETMETKDFDELILKEGGALLGTVGEEHSCLSKNFKVQNFVREIQTFSFSQNLRLDPKQPFAGGQLHNFSYRWQAVIPPVAEEGVFILRRHRFKELSFKDFSIEKKDEENLDKILNEGLPFLIGGATGSGKSTFLYALLKKYHQAKRIILLEEYKEIPLTNPFWMRLLAKKRDLESPVFFSLDKLFKESLRLRPDQIIMGELRSHEIFTFLEACQSGHSSCGGTIHAGSSQELKNRLELISLQNYKVNSFQNSLSLGLIFLERKGKTPSIRSVETYAMT